MPSMSPPGTAPQPVPTPTGGKHTSVVLPLAIAGVLLIVGVGAGVAILLTVKPKPGQARTDTLPSGGPSTTTPAVGPLVDIVVDSEPPGAVIYGPSGAFAGTTPDVVKVPATGTLAVRLKLQGYEEVTVTLDPAKAHKQRVNLVRGGGEAGASSDSHGGKPARPATHGGKPGVVAALPQPPPAPPDPPHRWSRSRPSHTTTTHRRRGSPRGRTRRSWIRTEFDLYT